MSNLNTKTTSSRRFLIGSLSVLGACATILGCSTAQESTFNDDLANTRGIMPTKCVDWDVVCGTPDFGSEQQMVQDNDWNLINQKLPSFNLVAPTAEFPFGGYEGKTIVIDVLKDDTVWEVLRFYNSNSAVSLSNDADEALIRNLVAELDSQMEEGRNSNLVYPGERLTLDLTYEPTRGGTMVPPGESAPAGSVEMPQGGDENRYYDGTPPSTNPDLGTSTSEDAYGYTPPAPSCDTSDPSACNPPLESAVSGSYSTDPLSEVTQSPEGE